MPRIKPLDIQTIFAGVLLPLAGAAIDNLSWGQHILSHAPAAAITAMLLGVGALIASAVVTSNGTAVAILAGVLIAAGSAALVIAIPVTVVSVVGFVFAMPLLEVLTYVGIHWPALIVFGLSMLWNAWAFFRRARQLVTAAEPATARHALALVISGALGFFVAVRGADVADSAWINAQLAQVTQTQPEHWPAAFQALSNYPLCTPRRCRAFACDHLYGLFGAKKGVSDTFQVPAVPPEHEAALAPFLTKPSSVACIEMR